jgi:hypothetical protein
MSQEWTTYEKSKENKKDILKIVITMYTRIKITRGKINLQNISTDIVSAWVDTGGWRYKISNKKIFFSAQVYKVWR